MKRTLARALIAATLALPASQPLLAQSSCTPEQVNAAIDAYANEPYGVRAYRVMAGLGDPGIDQQSFQDNEWTRRDEWRTLVSRLLPDRPVLQDPAYNCRIAYPLETLKARVAKLTGTHPYVKQWLMAQEAVFAACANDSASIAMPPPAALSPDLAQMQLDDRAYQQASIAFYKEPAKAVEQFRAIGASASPHKAAARYNVANLLANAKDIAGARAETRAILSDPSLTSVHEITRQLEGYVANVEDSAAGWASLLDANVEALSLPAQEVLANDVNKRRYSSALYDIVYAGVGPKRDDWWITNTLPQNATLSKALADSARKHPMVLFALTGQTVQDRYDAAPWALVGPLWQAWSASYVDRAMALQPNAMPPVAKAALEALKATEDVPARGALWTSAAAAVEKAKASCGAAPETGAVAALVMNAVRVFAQAGDYAALEANIAKLGLGQSKLMQEVVLPKLARHLLARGEAEQGRALLKSLPLADLQRQNSEWADIASLFAGNEAAWLDAAVLAGPRLTSPAFNLLSAAQLRRLAADPRFTADQRALFMRVAWTRDFALGKPGKLDDVIALNPQIGATLSALEQQHPKLNREQLRLLTILRNPRFGILVNSPDYSDPIEAQRSDFAELDQFDHNDKNWWCPFETDRHLAAVRLQADQLSGLMAAREYNVEKLKPLLDDGAAANLEARRDAMLKSHPVIAAANWKELDALAKAQSAPRQLTLAATRWAKRAAKSDEAAAEALARSMTVTRYGCNWHGGHKAYAQPAHELLRTKFAATQWAKDTPYWFDCMDQVWDAQGNKVPNCAPKPWPKQEPLR